jgi:glycine hydroxymethyltransferase
MTLPWEVLFTRSLDQVDHQVFGKINEQVAQNAVTVNLIASESYAPRATLEAEVSTLINCNASGYPPRRLLGGSGILDAIEAITTQRARDLFGAEHANVQALSSTIANAAVVRALVPRGGRILSFAPSAGGHMSHGAAKHLSGQEFEVLHFGTVGDADDIDYEGAVAAARTFRPHLIVAGSSAYPRTIDFVRLRAIADEVGALMLADIAHVAGLVVAGLHPNPVPVCDVVTTSTHKTLCGPRTGGLVLSRARHAQAIDAALSPGLQAAGGAHIMAARAVLFQLVAKPEFHGLMQAVVAHARVLAEALSKAGLRLYGHGTDTHMVVIDLRHSGWEADEVVRRLFEHGILVNAVTLPPSPGGVGRTGLRLGSNAMTIRGADTDAFCAMGACLGDLLRVPSDPRIDPVVREQVRSLADRYPVPRTHVLPH